MTSSKPPINPIGSIKVNVQPNEELSVEVNQEAPFDTGVILGDTQFTSRELELSDEYTQVEFGTESGTSTSGNPLGDSTLYNTRYLKGADPNVKEFLESVNKIWGIDLTTQDLTLLSSKLNTPQEVWKFYALMIRSKVQGVNMGFRTNTIQTGGINNTRGPGGALDNKYMGNVRSTQRRSGQRASNEMERLQAVNTQTSVIGRQMNINAFGRVGYYNNGLVISSDIFERVYAKIEALGPNWTLESISKDNECFQVVSIIFQEVRKFLSVSTPAMFREVTTSFFLSEGNGLWLSEEFRRHRTAGSYYMFCTNGFTLAALDTANRRGSLRQMTQEASVESNKKQQEVTASATDAYLMTAESPMFKDYLYPDGHDALKGEDGAPDMTGLEAMAQLLMAASTSEFNRSVTLPTGFILGDSSTPNPTIPEMTGLLSSLEPGGNTDEHGNNSNEAGANPNFKPLSGQRGSKLLGALALIMMFEAGYPVQQYANWDKVLEVKSEYPNLEYIANPFKDPEYQYGDINLKGSDILIDCQMVARQEITLFTPWLINLLVGTTASNRQGVVSAINRMQSDSLSDEDDDEDEDEYDGVVEEGDDENPVEEIGDDTTSVTPIEEAIIEPNNTPRNPRA